VPVTCPTCGFGNVEGARFCSSCGASLLAAPARRERKFATALFADLVGSTSLGEREDPEVVQSLVGRTFDRLSQEIERYGGLLEKFMGDAVLAVFGVPSSHEDDPERAVRTAIEMQAVLSELNRGFAAEGRPELSMRVGVEAGEVLVDVERASGPRDRMLTGDAVNTAARLQTAAEPGRVVVGPAVYASTKDVIDYRELPPLELKGKAQAVPAWEALRVKARRRGERAPLGLESRLVGRDEELSVLKQTLHRVEGERRPALVTVLGNAGVGKSRLTWELLKYVEGLPQFVYWRKGRSLAYGNLSYSALAEAVKAQCEILEDDPPDVVGEKADRAVQELFGDLEVAPQIRALVGAGGERQFSREDLFEAWRRFLERLAARYPLMLVLEDIHWADAGLLDFVDHLADWAQGPIFVLTMARPELLEIRPGWGGGKRNYSAIYLDPLSAVESEAMIEDLLAASLPPDVKRLVVERSEGNPLYTEEIIRMFIDRGVLRASGAARWELALPVDEVEVPRSIQGLIAARLDSLPAEEKAVLQDAAVVGRAFWLGAVARLSGRSAAEVREPLGRLRVKEIVVPREPPTFSGELEYAFRHVLIRDVAYESLPKATRAEKHVEAARWAEERAGERAEEMAELLATHHLAALGYLDELGGAEEARADVERDAYRWARAAAERSFRLKQATEASRWYRSALELAERLHVDAGELAALWSDYGNACFGVEPLGDVNRAHEESLRLALVAGDMAMAGRAESNLVFMSFTLGDDAATLAHADRALAYLEPFGDSEALADALHSLGWFHWRRGHLDEAEEPLRRSEEMARRIGATTVLGQAVSTLGVLLANRGTGREGLALIEEGFRIAKETGDLALLLRNYNNLPATLHDLAPDPVREEAILREGLEVVRKAGVRDSEAWILGSLGEHMADRGRLEEAERFQREALEAARGVDNPVVAGMRAGSLTRVLALRGRTGEAQELLAESMAIEAANPEPQTRVPLYATESLVARALGDIERETAVLLEGAEYIGEMEQNAKELVLFELVRNLAAAGRPEEAARYLEQLARSVRARPVGRPFELWARGLLAPEPEEAARLIASGVEELERLDRRIELARCLADLAAAEARLGVDPRQRLERAVALLEECGAALYAREAREALAAAAP
jgi:class 3 adenylate cyclase/tetratricopeptide (TPR) repeat protein